MRFFGYFLAAFLAVTAQGSGPAAETSAPDTRNGLFSSHVLRGLLGNQIKNESDTRPLATKVPPRTPVSKVPTTQAQTMLNDLGFDAGVPDGIAGPRTRAAVIRFQKAARLPGTGKLDPRTVHVLSRAHRILKVRPGLSPDEAMRRAIPGTDGTRPFTAAAAQASVTPVRRFAHADEYPPERYRGYGLIVFKSGVSSFDRERHRFFCEAYMTSILHVRAIGKDEPNQFVTIWPLKSPATARALNGRWREPASSICNIAIDDYDNVLAAKAIEAAKKAGFDEQGAGPFLLGWLPGAKYGQADALILTLDLSHVEDYEMAQSLFQDWKYDIQSDPDLLKPGFRLEKLRRKVRRWSDTRGPGLFSIVWRG